MARAREADRASVPGYAGRSSFSPGASAQARSGAANTSMARAREADRASVPGYAGRSSFSPGPSAQARSGAAHTSMARAREADRASVPGYAGRSSFSEGPRPGAAHTSMARAREADRASVPGYTLARGATGERVRALQNELRSAGFNPGKVDGVFGRRTERALRDYERSLGPGGGTARAPARGSTDLVRNIKDVERRMPGTGNCARAVNRAIKATTGVRIFGNANQLKHSIHKAGFREVKLSLEEALKTPGLVLTWDRTNTPAGSRYGHTAITTGDGKTSVSDYVERDTLASSDRMDRQGLRVFQRVP
ncbi:MAG: peptidoglycan-binding protein [Myxococcaceae bacterium]|jgi:peptidoglycan hydrolase-like protein with peptidoglycan-binding domain|nr:peptidoglycan-binding protein [Myxococcaceae bacterium]MCA3016193.1 peptidoglycan-binding protein [Myxococcaceae bacterium]